jgi:hypothetical protein
MGGGSVALTIGGPREMTSEGDVVACRRKERGLPRLDQLEEGMRAARLPIPEVNDRACATKGRRLCALLERDPRDVPECHARDAMSARGHSLFDRCRPPSSIVEGVFFVCCGLPTRSAMVGRWEEW